MSLSTPGSTQRGGSSGLGYSRPHKSGRQTGLQTGLQPHFLEKIQLFQQEMAEREGYNNIYFFELF